MTLKNNSLHQKFLKYVIPSLISFALSGVYCIVDGYFIGNSLGDNGLAAINIAFPLTSFIQSAGTGIGMGGAIFYSIYKAREDHDTKNQFFTMTLAMLAFASVVLTVGMILNIGPLLKLCGSSETILPLAKEYATVILLGTIFQLFGTGLVPFIRNMGSASSAMIAMLAGFFANVGLDYLTIWVLNWGMAGAAIASVAGQLLTFIVCVISIYLNRNSEQLHYCGMDVSHIKRIISVGLSPFGLTFIPNLSLLFINRQALQFGGDNAITVYSVIAYAITVVYLLLQGVSDGCQPLISHFYGKQDAHSANVIRCYSFIYSLVFALVGVIGLIYFAYPIGFLFGASEVTCALVKETMPVFAIGCFFVAISRTIISYFYACTINLYASICIYGEAVLMIGLLLTLPYIGSLNLLGVWLATPITQFSIMAIALVLLLFGPKSKQSFHHENMHAN